jgi:hypothetical protein
MHGSKVLANHGVSRSMHIRCTLRVRSQVMPLSDAFLQVSCTLVIRTTNMLSAESCSRIELSL